MLDRLQNRTLRLIEYQIDYTHTIVNMGENYVNV